MGCWLPNWKLGVGVFDPNTTAGFDCWLGVPNAGVDVVVPKAGGLAAEPNEGVGVAEPNAGAGEPNAGAELSAAFAVEPNAGVEALLAKPPNVGAENKTET